MSDSVATAPDQVRVIRTPDQRLRVFVSSTLEELAPERAAARAAIQQLHLTPVMFELGARPHPPRVLYRAYLEQSHVFLGIYGERYGWLAPEMEISGLEDEYLLAGDRPRLIYVREPSPDREERLALLLARIEADGRASYKVFRTPEELGALIANDLAILLTERFVDAGVRTDDATGAPRDQLPVPPTALIGREREVAAIAALLERPEVRLVTLVGPGGIGKTRLALEVAARLLHRFRDGVQFISLATVLDPALVLPTVAAGVGIRAEGKRPLPERLAVELADQDLLLVIDNFEQVLAAGPELARLLETCRSLTMLVTSRAALRLRGEHEYPVPPLAVPDASLSTPDAVITSSAVELFVARARETRPDFALDRDNAAAVAELVRRLDGIPLAIELAAARTRLLGPADLLRRVGDRLDVLKAELVDLPPRQRTLRATIDWSYQLLDAAERVLFARLGIFAGAFTLDAAEAVCGDSADVLDTLASLVDKSLVVPLSQQAEPRFHLLRTVRDFARERLGQRGEFEDLEERHARYYVALAEEATPALRDERQGAWLDRLEEELDDLRAAMTWALQHDPGASVILGYGLRIFWWLRDHMAEARDYEEAALAHLDELPEQQRARLLFMAGASAWLAGDYEVAVPRLEESVELARSLGDELIESAALPLLSAQAHERGDVDTAEAHLASSLETMRQRNDPWGVAYVLLQYSQFAARIGDIVRATAMVQELLDLARRLGNAPMTAQGLVFLGYLELIGGNVPASREHIGEAARMYRGLRYREGLSYCLTGFAAIALTESDPERAATVLGAAAGLREQIGSIPWPFMRPIIDGLEARARETAGEERFERAWERGRSLAPDEMAAYALEALEDA